MKTLALAFVVLGGCLPSDEAPLVDFKSASLSVDIIDWKPPNLYPPPDTIMVWLWRAGPRPLDNAAKPDDCITIRARTTITANGEPGALDNTGRYDEGSAGFENNCIPPAFSFLVGADRPPTIDVELDDGTAARHVTIATDAQNLYHAMSCDFADCE
jgi:hypothetical protein